ncbi:MAG TPA: transcription antitermination factor NusB [Candidatus Babeliales bacterium]|nr:transcription antitermination factor NusB [Candidatus Babeliales bacterium]
MDDQIKPEALVETEINDAQVDQWRSFNDLSARSKRALIFHLLYAIDSYDSSISAEGVADMFNRGYELDIPLDSDVVKTSDTIAAQHSELDKKYLPFLTNWRADRLGVATKLILRYAVWELINTDVSSSIIINEAVELAKAYAERDAYKFINGILEEVLKTMPGRAQLGQPVDQK